LSKDGGKEADRRDFYHSPSKVNELFPDIGLVDQTKEMTINLSVYKHISTPENSKLLHQPVYIYFCIHTPRPDATATPKKHRKLFFLNEPRKIYNGTHLVSFFGPPQASCIFIVSQLQSQENPDN
jgi:hypothetical protein